MFRLRSLHPGPDLTVTAAASLAGVPLAPSRAALAELTSTSLLTEHSPGRFAFHDLLRAYATEQARSTQSGESLRAAQLRLLDYYMRAAHAATTRMYPARHGTPPPPPLPGTHQEELTSYDGALAWLEAEHQVLLAAAAHAATIGAHLYCWHLCWALGPYLNRHGLTQQYIATRRMALTAAELVGDPAVLGRSLYDLAHAVAKNREYEESYRLLDQSADLFTELGDRSSLARVHHWRSLVLHQHGRTEEALEHGREGLRIRMDLGDLAGAGYSENGIAWHYVHLGRFEGALAHGGRAVALMRQCGSRSGLADALDTVGRAYAGIGEHLRAIECFQESVDVYREIGDPSEREALIVLGDEHNATGDCHAARQSWEQALAITGEDPFAEVAAQLAERLRGLDDVPFVPTSRLPG
jgi:tetratricopeptide (TPR) repeat protein